MREVATSLTDAAEPTTGNHWGMVLHAVPFLDRMRPCRVQDPGDTLFGCAAFTTMAQARHKLGIHGDLQCERHL